MGKRSETDHLDGSPWARTIRESARESRTPAIPEIMEAERIDEVVSRETTLNGDYIAETFGEGGHLSRVVPEYVPRPGQIRMTRAVDRAITEQSHLLAEGLCGIGKTLSALVPATYHAVKSGSRVLVVTANNALSEQYVERDLPHLLSAVPWEFTYALLKGRANFLCLDKLDKTVAKNPDRDRDLHARIQQWAGETKTGDRSELTFEPKGWLWGQYSVSAEACKGGRCKKAGDCFALAAQRRAKEASVIVTNYHLLFAHLMIQEETGGQAGVLPDCDVVVCDEAHRAADIARDFFGFRITPYAVKWASRLLLSCGQPELLTAVERANDDFFGALRDHADSREYKARIKRPMITDPGPLTDLLKQAVGVYEEARESAVDEDRNEELRIAQRAARRLADRIWMGIGLHEEEKAVYFIETGRSVALCSRLINAGPKMKELLFDGYDTVVCMSATLSVNGKFDYVKKETGAKDAKTIAVESPFDFRKQALLVVPSGLPQPNDRDFTDAVAAQVLSAIKLSGGRLLGLFTSYRNLDAVYERVKNCGYRVLRQGDMPRTQLVEEFRKDVASVLLGTESFWAGVDVPGESLSCLVIDRLPFLTPADPVLDAVSERDRNWFGSYSLPRAVISFRQGAGRLIRRVDDRGCIVVLDRRITDKGYGKQFTRSIPSMPWSKDLQHVGKFLGRTG